MTYMTIEQFRQIHEDWKQSGLSVQQYGGDMPEELATILLDNIDYHYNKVKCRQIELIMPKLMKMVEGEMVSMR